MRTIVVILFVLLAACGPRQNEFAPVEEWPAIGTREAAESTRVALTPAVETVGSVAVQIVARNPQDALRQMKDALAENTAYAQVSILVVSGNSLVLTAIYESARSGNIVWGGDWQPTRYVMMTASTSWAEATDFWGETP
jgi:hypothetical protein